MSDLNKDHMKKIVIGIIILFLVILGVRLVLGGDEDSWVCTEEGWVKHGQPKELPTGLCGANPICDAIDNIADCPDACVVCPPCPECSSFSCQSEEFCLKQGFDRSWYDDIKSKIYTFEDCVASGQPVMETYPRQCATNDRIFTENIGNELEKLDFIRIDSPRPNDFISSPVVISGEARGNWFFEGDFPVLITNWDGLIIAEGYASAQGDWMTEDFVPFEATLKFRKPEYKDSGSLILQRDNPSGLPENDDALEIPIFFQ